MNTPFLARRGVEGPLRVVEGPNGVDNLLHMQLRVDWDKQGYEGVVESTIKKYNAQIPTQSSIQCIIELVRQNKRALSAAEGFEARKVTARVRGAAGASGACAAFPNGRRPRPTSACRS
jgi:2-methylcitrate dehydratase